MRRRHLLSRPSIFSHMSGEKAGFIGRTNRTEKEIKLVVRSAENERHARRIESKVKTISGFLTAGRTVTLSRPVGRSIRKRDANDAEQMSLH